MPPNKSATTWTVPPPPNAEAPERARGSGSGASGSGDEVPIPLSPPVMGAGQARARTNSSVSYDELPQIRAHIMPRDWWPNDDDRSLEAIDARATRGNRLGNHARDIIGHPTYTGPDGKAVPATGLWGVLEPISKMAADYELQKQRRSGVLGFFAARGELIVDKVLWIVILGVIGYWSRHYWTPIPPPQVPVPIVAPAPAAPAGH
jgi:hypothetical protein